ncbi:DUF4169 family protein [Pseudorhodobacter sp.]|uniref:DUF4169 family protein n=1 Tax=Pseudorhodobacter sp. TaxID=1934400 RepID=UPI002AFE3347|nr:DUF4169 family protein [Pseudorhodobacter sp.]
MAEIINLRSVKKARIRAALRAQGDANAARFGRSKAERAVETARADKASQTLDGHKRDDTATNGPDE